MKKNFKSAILGSLIIASLAFPAMQAGAIGFRHNLQNTSGKVLSEAKFNDAISNVRPDQVALVFGYPDQILSLKSPDGELQGVVWVYRNAVKQDDGVLSDARLVLIEGKLQYVALSKAS